MKNKERKIVLQKSDVVYVNMGIVEEVTDELKEILHEELQEAKEDWFNKYGYHEEKLEDMLLETRKTKRKLGKVDIRYCILVGKLQRYNDNNEWDELYKEVSLAYYR